VTDRCITCGDAGTRMRVLSNLPDGVAICETFERMPTREQVAIDLVGPVGSGDEILVHAGVAIARLGDACPAGHEDRGAAA
jgi:hydrogenase maturation factor